MVIESKAHREKRRLRGSDEGRPPPPGRSSLIWRLRFGPCWCYGPSESGSFDFVRLTTSSHDLGPVTENFLIASERVIDGSHPVYLQVLERVPSPKLVVATAACPAAAHFWEELPVGWSPVDEFLPVDIHVEECVIGNPEALMAGVVRHLLADPHTSHRRGEVAMGQSG